MKKEAVLVTEYKQIRYYCPLRPDKGVYILSGDISADIYIPNLSEYELRLPVNFDDNGDLYNAYIDGATKINLSNKKKARIGEIFLHLEFHYEEYIRIYLGVEEMFTFGKNSGNRIILTNCKDNNAFTLVNIEGEWMLRIYSGAKEPIYINGKICTVLQNLSDGDEICYYGYRIVMKDVYFTFYHQFAYRLGEITSYTQPQPDRSRFPNFKRPPRKVYPEPDEIVMIPTPPSPPQKNTMGLIVTIAPTLAMVLMTVLMGVLLGRGILIFATAGISFVTMCVSVYRFLKDRRKRKDEEAERVQFYGDLLDRKRKKIRELMQQQRLALNYTYPTIEECIRVGCSFDSRLWERAVDQEEFLNVRVGTGSQNLSFSIDYKPPETKDAEKDSLMKDAAELAEKYTKIHNIPLVISLKDYYLGVVGSGKAVVSHVMALIGQLCIFQSYRDFSLVVIYSEDDNSDFIPLKWLPHTWIGDRQFKGLVKDERTRDNVLGSLYQHIKERQRKHESERNLQGVFFSPILFVVANAELIYDHAIMEYFIKDFRHLGVYAIFISDAVSSLPEPVKTILTIQEDHGRMQNADGSSLEFHPEQMTRTELEHVCRSLAPIQHVSTTSKTLPKSITLFEMFHVEDTDELDIPKKWQENKTYKTLAVPIGMRTADDWIELNLHEKAHGPHGLLAGTTGSGKSEILQSYILSLAIHFHPHDIAFLLIDYKGGGMANLFDELPHLLGTITNLDGAQTMRALVAIKSELRRRQEVFSKYEVNHIDQYQKLYYESVVKDPMPHLFIISDEFAELKTEKPEFIRELVSAARIGRSLGIHLILATQKPTGVVDDQIWSNSKFRICLKVQNASDSNEMIKTPDAASLTLPGRGYLQVGNNEIYELFQSAYSGAAYRAKSSLEFEGADENIYLFNDLGQAQLLTQDFSNLLSQDEKQSEKITQLDAVVHHIHGIFEKAGQNKIPSPWLPPIEKRIFLPDLLNNPEFKPDWSEKDEVEITVGLLDQPQLQKQSLFTINFSKEGHVLAFGSASTGKSTFLRLVAVSLALKYSPEEVHFYILDFGNNNILPLRELPHSADSFSVDTQEKTGKFIKFLLGEMKRRKDLLGNAGVSNTTVYKKVTGKRLPSLFLFFDNVDLVKEQQMTEMEQILNDISRDGLALGIYLVMSASKSSALRYNIQANIRNKLAFYMIDRSEIYMLVGRSELESEFIPGRGLVKLDDVYCFQACLPTYGNTEEQLIQNFNKLMNHLKDAWSGNLPDPIPMMPEVVRAEDFYQMRQVKKILAANNQMVPIALEDENLEVFSIDLDKISHFCIVGSNMVGKTNLLKTIIKSVSRKQSRIKVYILDNSLYKLNIYRNHPATARYINDVKGIEELLSFLWEEVTQRKNAYAEKIRSGEIDMTPYEYYKTLDTHLVLINSFSAFQEKLLPEMQNKVKDLLEESKMSGIHFVFSSNAQDYVKSYDVLSKAIKTIETGITLVNSDQQQVWTFSYKAAKAKPLIMGEGLYVQPGNMIRIKIPLN